MLSFKTWFIALLLFPYALVAQETNFQFNEIENLLSQELIKHVARDSSGYLWVATDAGVLRYDGEETKRIYEGLPSPYTKKILNISNEKLCVLHDYGIKEIVQKNDSIWLRPMVVEDYVVDEPLGIVRSAYVDHAGDIWVGEQHALVRINEQGLIRFHMVENELTSYYRSFSFAEDIFGTLWVVSLGGDLMFFDRKRQAFQKVPIKDRLHDISCLETVIGDFLLLGGREGIQLLKVDSEHNILSDEFLGGIKDISSIKCISNTEIYIGTWHSGVYYLDFDHREGAHERVNSLTFNDVVNMHFDELRNELWVVGSEDVGILRHSLTSKIYEVDNRIESITSQGDAIYYTTGTQIYSLDKLKRNQPTLLLSDREKYHNKILVEGDRIWIGDSFGGVSYYDLKNGKKVDVLTEPESPIQFIHVDSEGNKWFTGHSKGLVRLDTQLQVNVYKNLNTSSIIRESNDGKIYCMNQFESRFLFRYEEENDLFNALPIWLPGSKSSGALNIYDFQFDDENNIWLATDQGLMVTTMSKTGYDSVRSVGIPSLKEQVTIWAMAISGDHLYLATPFGIIVYDKRENHSINLNSGSTFPSTRFKDRELKFYNENYLLFATAKGFGILDLSEVKFKRTPQPIFSWARVNGKKIDIGVEYTFPYESNIEAEFISLSFPVNDLNYQYRIYGIDDEWTPPSGNKNISLFGLADGAYEIEIRAKENGKTWSHSNSFKFAITRPWFKTWWGICIFLASATLIIWLSVKLFHFRLIRQRKKLHRIIEERTEQIYEQKNQIIEQQRGLIEQKNEIIQQKEELLDKNNAIYKSKQALADANFNFLKLKEKQLEDQIDSRNKQITTHALNIIQKNEILKTLQEQLARTIKSSSDNSFRQEIKNTMKLIDESFRLDKDWEEFKLYFEQVYTGFYSKLKLNFQDLTNQELRLCALIRMNLTNSECASILGISPDSIKVSRSRLRKKLNLESNRELTDFIMKI